MKPTKEMDKNLKKAMKMAKTKPSRPWREVMAENEKMPAALGVVPRGCVPVKELGIIFDTTVEDEDEEISVMDHGDSVSIGHEGPFDMENILKLSKMLNQWLDKFQVAKEFRPKKKS